MAPEEKFGADKPLSWPEGVLADLGGAGAGFFVPVKSRLTWCQSSSVVLSALIYTAYELSFKWLLSF